MSPLTATARRSYPADPAVRPPAHVARGGAQAVAPAHAPAPRPDHLRVVRPTERRRARLSPATGVALTGLLFALLFAVAIAQTLLVQGQVRLDRLDGELTTEQARYQVLRKDVAQLESPGRIVAEAQKQGMVVPDDLVYLQPPTPDAATAGDDEPVEPAGADPGGDVDANGAWSTVKPLLAAPAS